jgi:hypothetical protein
VLPGLLATGPLPPAPALPVPLVPDAVVDPLPVLAELPVAPPAEGALAELPQAVSNSGTMHARTIELERSCFALAILLSSVDVTDPRGNRMMK